VRQAEKYCRGFLRTSADPTQIRDSLRLFLTASRELVTVCSQASLSERTQQGWPSSLAARSIHGKEDTVHLLLSDPEDSCCLLVRQALESRQCEVRVLPNPLAHPAQFEWRLDNQKSMTRLVLGDGRELSERDIESVLVRRTGWINSAGWDPADLAYMQAEMQAALIGWLWSLPCPVINRYPAEIWYRPHPPLLTWQPLLRSCGLSVTETLLTNAEEETRVFRQRLRRRGITGAVYGPLTSDARYLVATDSEWNGLDGLQRIAPISLATPHEAAQSICVIGERVVWAGEPRPEMIQLEPRLRRFAQTAGLALVEFALAASCGEICVIAIEPQPVLGHFSNAAQHEIAEALAELLTDDSYLLEKGMTPRLAGRLS
jgi:hypothetical protein